MGKPFTSIMTVPRSLYLHRCTGRATCCPWDGPLMWCNEWRQALLPWMLYLRKSLPLKPLHKTSRPPMHKLLIGTAHSLTHTHTHTHTTKQVCTCACAHVCLHAYTHVLIYLHTCLWLPVSSFPSLMKLS
jgi:hypothetical protein